MRRENDSLRMKIWSHTNLFGVCTGMDAQQTTVLVAVMVRGGVVHPVMPTERREQDQWELTEAAAGISWLDAHLLSTFRYRRVNMPFPGPPAEKEPPPPIIMLSTAKGMKSSSCEEEQELSSGLS